MTGEFTSNKKAAFPYILAANDDQEIFSQDSVPDGFILSDPDHLTGFDIDSLYRHWLRRQQKKLSPFVILKASPQHQMSVPKSAKAKGKRKMDYEEVDSNDGEVMSENAEERKEEELEQSEEGDNLGDGEEEEDEEEEDDISPVEIYLQSIRLDDYTNPVAGPSKLPPSKKLPKENTESSNGKEDPIPPVGPSLLSPPKKGPAGKKSSTSNAGAVGSQVCFWSKKSQSKLIYFGF